MLRSFLLLLLLTTGLLPTARGQEITLPQLLHLRELSPTSGSQALSAALASEHFSDWVSKPEEGGEPLSWVWWPPSAGPGQLPQARLTLRPNHGSYDVVLSVRRLGTLSHLRREAERLKLALQPVTCLGCTGERFTGQDYTLALYQGKPEPFPFIIVVQTRAPGAISPSPAPQ